MNLRNLLAATAAAGAALTIASAADAANVTQTATASVAIVAPVTITKSADLSFGEIAQPSTGTNLVSIAATAGAQVNVSGSGNGYVANTTSSPAHFVLNGYKGDSFSSVSASGTMSSNGTTISPTWTTSVANATGTGPWTMASATADIYVGGSFSVDSTATPIGNYTGQLTVTVAYP